MLADGTEPQGRAAVAVDAAVAAEISPDGPLDEALAGRLVEVQVDDLVGAGACEVRDDVLVTSLDTFARWALERDGDGWVLVVARPGVNSTLAWGPDLEWDGPGTEARAELDEVLARVHPLLAGLPLHVC